MKVACFLVKTGYRVCKPTLKYLCVLRVTWFPGNLTPGFLILGNDLVISPLTSILEDDSTAALLIYTIKNGSLFKIL